MSYFYVAVKAPLPQPLVYRSEDPLVFAGKVVQAPLGSRVVSGLVLSSADLKNHFAVKDILSVDHTIYPLSAVRIRWIQWLSRYYTHPIGLTAGLCYSLKKFKKKKLDSFEEGRHDSSHLTLDQRKAVENIQKTSAFKVHLLHGVTGSGKTEVYFQLIESQIKKNKQALVIVPEISLTPQLYSRFSKKFPNQVGLLHSGLTGRKRYWEWQDLIEGKKKILLGARSALFCPLKDLSLIIVDEEHEPHFKQEEKLKYHGRDSAIMLAQMYNIPIVLGSATPDLTTWVQAQKGKYEYHSLENRFRKYPMPDIKIVDLKQKKDMLPFWLSRELFQAVKKNLEDKQQTALFLNRRGQSSLALCLSCGQAQNCPNCDVALTLHSGQYLVCHYCSYSAGVSQSQCCKNSEWSYLGIGTQGVYSEIQKLFPQAKIKLADSDHIQTTAQFNQFVADMIDRKIDILIGTQMIAKGLDFPNLHLVGLIMADLALYGQGYRSAERCFQIITQMAGRSGRHSVQPGQVIVQTYNPDHYAVQTSANMNFRKMALKELEYRKKLQYPPYCRLAVIQVSSLKKETAEKTACLLLKKLKETKISHFECLGPAPEPIFKLRSRYRYQILIKSSFSAVIQKICDYVWNLKEIPSQARVQINRDV